jgi:hypothetical protein
MAKKPARKKPGRKPAPEQPRTPIQTAALDPVALPTNVMAKPVQWSERHRALAERGAQALNRGALLSLWQEIALNFYPERADFTFTRSTGQEFASHLSTSHPTVIRRDLGDAVSTMMRSGDWMDAGVNRDPSTLDAAGLQWLEAATKTQRAIMYAPRANFQRATKACDHDYIAIGNGVIEATTTRDRTSMLYREHHPRDVAWWQNAEREICGVVLRDKPTATDLLADFPRTASAKVREMVEKDNGKRAYEPVDCRHFVMRADEYEYPDDMPGRNMPYVSIWLDIQHNQVMEEIGIPTRRYIIPRWKVISGSPYGFSPATMIGLPDARLLQAMTYTLQRVGEKTADPPTVGVEESIRSDMQLWPGGHTWVDIEHDERRMGDALRYLQTDARGLPLAFSQQQDQRMQMAAMFYLDKIAMPTADHEMTAYEFGKRLKEFARLARPFFEPIESEYNQPLCDDTFTIAMLNGAFGPPQAIPESLQGKRTVFTFKSPIAEAEDESLVQTFFDSLGIAKAAGEMDPAAGRMLNVQKGAREAFRGRGTPTDWVLDEDTMKAITAETAEEMQAAKMAQMAAGGGAAAQSVGDGIAAIKGAVGGEEGAAA